jgi:CIC family chloride channel protein
LTTPADSEPSGNLALRRFRWLLPALEWLRPKELQVTLALAGVVGFLGAMGAVIFRKAAGGMHWLFTGHWNMGLTESFSHLTWAQRVAIPTAGGAAAGLVLLLTARFVRQAHTTDYMEAVVIGDGVLPIRKSLLKSLSALFSISSGASIGKEGPIVQLAALLASLVGRFTRVSRPRLRLLVACGAAAGIAAAYNAPIAGALFVSEIVLGTTAMEIFGPLVFASVIATLTTRQFLGVEPLYQITHFSVAAPSQMILLLGLGIICGLLSPLYLLLLRTVETRFSNWNVPTYVRLATGGLIVGVLAVWYPEVCGNGYSSVSAALHDTWPWQELAFILLLKIAATAATFGSGAVGGVFTPTLFVGTGIGFLFGALFHGIGSLPPAFALIGMGAFLAASTRAPIMAIMMIFELTLDYEMILPLMLSCVTAYYIAQSFPVRGLYSETLRRKGRWIFDSELRRMRVGDIMKKDPPAVGPEAHFEEICRQFLQLRHNYLYVADNSGRFLGAIAFHDLKRFLGNPDLARLVIARDIMHENFPSLGPHDALATVFERFARHAGERLPVLAQDGSELLIGSVAKADALLAFAEQPENRAGQAG